MAIYSTEWIDVGGIAAANLYGFERTTRSMLVGRPPNLYTRLYMTILMSETHM